MLDYVFPLYIISLTQCLCIDVYLGIFRRYGLASDWRIAV